MKLCKVCGKNMTGRLMDVGGGKRLPVCDECLLNDRWKELIPPAKPSKPKPAAEDTTPPSPESGAKEPAVSKAPAEGEGFGDYLCPKCKVTHRAGSKIHKRHLKLLK